MISRAKEERRRKGEGTKKNFTSFALVHTYIHNYTANFPYAHTNKCACTHITHTHTHTTHTHTHTHRRGTETTNVVVVVICCCLRCCRLTLCGELLKLVVLLEQLRRLLGLVAHPAVLRCLQKGGEALSSKVQRQTGAERREKTSACSKAAALCYAAVAPVVQGGDVRNEERGKEKRRRRRKGKEGN